MVRTHTSVPGSRRATVRQLACDILQKCSTEQDRDEPYLTTLVGFFSRVGHMHSGTFPNTNLHGLIASAECGHFTDAEAAYAVAQSFQTQLEEKFPSPGSDAAKEKRQRAQFGLLLWQAETLFQQNKIVQAYEHVQKAKALAEAMPAEVR